MRLRQPAPQVARTPETQSTMVPWKTARASFTIVAICSFPALIDLSREWAGAALTAIVGLPLAYAAYTERRILVGYAILPVGVMWFLAAGLPALAPRIYHDPIWSVTNEEYLTQATLWMYRAWAAASLVYWGTLAISRRRREKPFRQSQVAAEQILRILIGIVGLIAGLVFLIRSGGQAYSNLEGFSSVGTVDQVIYELRQLSLVYVFSYFFVRGSGEVHPIEKWLISANVVLSGVIVFASSSKLVALQVIAMWVLGNGLANRRRWLAKELFIGASAMLCIYCTFSFVTAYREELASNVDVAQNSVSEVIAVQTTAMSNAAASLLSDRAAVTGQRYDPSMFDRLGLVASFATVIKVSAGEPPFENAWESFLTPVYAVLPRAFFQEKVQFFDSGQFANQLGWKFGGFSVSLPGSLYWAWGYYGLIIGMAAFGWFLAYLQRNQLGRGPKAFQMRTVWAFLVLQLISVDVVFQSIIIDAVRIALLVALLRVLPALNFGRQSPLGT